MTDFSQAEATQSGPRATRDILDNHAICLLELQTVANQLEDAIGPIQLVGEDTLFLAIRDDDLVKYLIKATLTEVVE